MSKLTRSISLKILVGSGSINTGYEISSTSFNPADIRWISPAKIVVKPGEYAINISGLQTNADATIYAVAYTANRTIFPSTTYSVSSAIRYLEQYSAGGECLVSNFNELTVTCDGTYSGPPDYTRTDSLLTMNATNATSYQVIHNSDGIYFSADAYTNLAVVV